MSDLNDMVIFAKVAETQGISSASRELKMPKSKVSRRMAALEDELGVRLLERTTRSVHLTELVRFTHNTAGELSKKRAVLVSLFIMRWKHLVAIFVSARR